MDIEIKKFKPQDHKIKALIYGAAGSGKTVFAGTAPNVIFASAEAGLLSIADKEPDFMEIKSLKDLNVLYLHLRDGAHNYETVVIDSITEINEIAKLEIEKRTGHSLQLQDWGEVAQKMAALLRKFRDLPMNVLFIAQEQYINDEQKIKKIVPELNGKSATAIARFMDIVGYIHIEADGTRKIETSTNKNLLTKDRTKLIGDDTPLDFAEWLKLAGQIKVGKQKVTATLKQPTLAEETQDEAVDKAIKVITGQPHLKALQIELKNRGAANKEEALKILNESTYSAFVDFSTVTEELAQDLLIQLLQKNTSLIGNTVVENKMFSEDGEIEVVEVQEPLVTIDERQDALYFDYTDFQKVKKILAGLQTVTECVGLDKEIKTSFKNGDCTESVYRTLMGMVSARIAEINDGMNMPKRAKKIKKMTA